MTRRVLLITDSQERALITESILVRADCIVSARMSHSDDWSENIGGSDAVFIALESTSPEILNGIRRFNYEYPKPIIMFVDKDAEAAVDATEAGVSAYVVDGFGGQRTIRVRAIISAAMARFNAMLALKLELEKVTARLRKCETIKSAKIIQIAQADLGEKNIH